MNYVVDYPLLVFVLSFFAMWSQCESGVPSLTAAKPGSDRK